MSGGDLGNVLIKQDMGLWEKDLYWIHFPLTMVEVTITN